MISLSILTSSTVNLFADALRRELGRWGWDVQIWQSDFNQYRQDIANPDSPLYRNRPRAVILYLDGEDLFADWLRDPLSNRADAQKERARNAVSEVDNWVQIIRKRLPDSLLILNTIYLPPIHSLTGLEYHSPWGLSGLVSHYNLELGRLAEQHTDVLILDAAALAGDIGYRQWFDPRLWYLARCRLSADAVNTLARSAGALLRAWQGQMRKCLVLDLDNTLWGGVIGEDGPHGITLSEEGLGLAYVEFQQEILNLGRKGILLAVCSKNTEADALEVLRLHPSMRLRESSFAALRINWLDKATNLRELASVLNLGLDSFVFIDDNPAERELVRIALPEVYVPEWPDDPGEFKAALLAVASQHLAKISLTAEDQARTHMYRAHSERRALAESTETLEGYYRSLDMRAEIGLGDPFSIPRIAQLTQKTNQFNLTTSRYTEAEIRELAGTPTALVLWLRLRDRFSDEGIVGVLILKEHPTRTWTIDTFLLSCRVIGRTVENAFLGYACRMLRDRGAESLFGEYLPTNKNALVRNVYGDLGFESVEETDLVVRWRLSLAETRIAVPEWVIIEIGKEMTHA